MCVCVFVCFGLPILVNTVQFVSSVINCVNNSHFLTCFTINTTCKVHHLSFCSVSLKKKECIPKAMQRINGGRKGLSYLYSHQRAFKSQVQRNVGNQCLPSDY